MSPCWFLVLPQARVLPRRQGDVYLNVRCVKRLGCVDCAEVRVTRMLAQEDGNLGHVELVNS